MVGVDVRVELYPRSRRATVDGVYRLRNKTDEVIDSVHVVVPGDLDLRRLSFDRETEHVLDDDRHGYHIFALAQPLQPGDSLRVEFGVETEVQGFANSEENLDLVENGTFLNSAMLPSFGYHPDFELASDDVRRKHDLEPKERVAPLEDTVAVRNNYVSRDGDWIDFSMTVGTSPDQIALAPGYLQREWTQDGRRYFRYEMDSPILNMYSVLSARYVNNKTEFDGILYNGSYYDKEGRSLEYSVREALRHIEGCYAFCVMSERRTSGCWVIATRGADLSVARVRSAPWTRSFAYARALR